MVDRQTGSGHYAYNYYDWTTDGCSQTPPPASYVFNAACQQHDFGYRNFGKGLTLGRNESVRAAIDGHFKSEMYRICQTTYAQQVFQGAAACDATAYSMWVAVRNLSSWG